MNDKNKTEKYKTIIWLVLVAVLVLGLQCYNQYNDKDKYSYETTSEAESKIKMTPKQVIEADISKIVAGDRETIERYFGQSDVYHGLNLINRIAVAKIEVSPVNNDETNSIIMSEGLEFGTALVKLKINNISYKKVKEEVERALIKNSDNENDAETLENNITTLIMEKASAGILDNDVIIPVTIKYNDGIGSVVITEELKEGLTGGWYNPAGKE